ncbi:MAG: prepilin-type N-terminal cleavage/methylation domain-containing protein [Planctomycetota bacterium]|jgi:prepilin-type N-terminal cleavage/methylation domain-containing protein/prepilin-type processing-associated H-X9-DG protein
MTSLLRLPQRGLRAGFTLIELLAVILIISILAVALGPMVLEAVGASKVSACQANLRKVHSGITLYQMKYKRLPNESGVKFFAQLYSRQAIAPSKSNAEIFLCPGVDRGAVAVDGLPWEEWWSDLDTITGDYSTYAGRDTANYPLRQLTATEALMSDDNDGGMNHPTTTNVLFGDGSVQQYELVLLREEGLLAEGDEILFVGPDSPIEALRKLSLD